MQPSYETAPIGQDCASISARPSRPGTRPSALARAGYRATWRWRSARRARSTATDSRGTRRTTSAPPSGAAAKPKAAPFPDALPVSILLAKSRVPAAMSDNCPSLPVPNRSVPAPSPRRKTWSSTAALRHRLGLRFPMKRRALLNTPLGHLGELAPDRGVVGGLVFAAGVAVDARGGQPVGGPGASTSGDRCASPGPSPRRRRDSPSSYRHRTRD